jgi:flagellar motor protein MotB
MTKALGKLNGGDDDVKEQVKTLMKELLKVSGIAGEAWIEVRATGVQVTIAGDIAFDEGSAQLTKEARQFVEDYARVAQGAGSNVSVETYLATQGSFEEEDAGWELALKRADTVASTIGRSGVEGQFIRVSARGARLGADELKFVQAAEVLRLGLIVGEPGAEASVGTKQ